MAFIGLILIVVALNGVVSFGIASFVRSNVLAVIASTAITEMLVAIYFLTQAQHSADATDCILAANVTVIVTTPVIVCTSCGFIFCLRRFRRRHSD